jgi:ribulose-phosphate 3-epimerase
MIELAASILSANFARLGAETQAAVDGGATVLHVDIMDGHFVPNLTIGPPVVASLRKVSPVPFDCHLMIEHPDEFIPMFAQAGVDWISVHQEACTHLDRTLHLIASHGCKPGVVINPATPIHLLDEVLPLVHHVLVMSVNPGFGGQTFIPSSLKKIEALARIRESRGFQFRIEVDGGVHHDTAAGIVSAGADILVAGSAVFEEENPREGARRLLESARSTANRSGQAAQYQGASS